MKTHVSNSGGRRMATRGGRAKRCGLLAAVALTCGAWGVNTSSAGSHFVEAPAATDGPSVLASLPGWWTSSMTEATALGLAGLVFVWAGTVLRRFLMPLGPDAEAQPANTVLHTELFRVRRGGLVRLEPQAHKRVPQ